MWQLSMAWAARAAVFARLVWQNLGRAATSVAMPIDCMLSPANGLKEHWQGAQAEAQPSALSECEAELTLCKGLLNGMAGCSTARRVAQGQHDTHGSSALSILHRCGSLRPPSLFPSLRSLYTC